MQTTIDGTKTSADNLVILRNCLHARDVAPLRWSHRPMPWSKLLSAAVWASSKLPLIGGAAAVHSFIYKPTISPFVAGAYMRLDRSIEVQLPDLDKHPEPQIAVLTVLHEMSHAMLHYNTPHHPSYALYCEAQADLTAITACWLMGYQLPASAFGYIKTMLSTENSRNCYHALIDADFEPLLLLAARAIAEAFAQ